jgi:urate oxidase
MSAIAWNRYGKAAIRLVKIERRAATDAIVDFTVDVQLEGAFEAVYAGDNRSCLATDTMKNTVYALARQHRIDSAEAFAQRVADHFVGKPAVASARVQIVEKPWTAIDAGGQPNAHAFVQPGGEEWTATVVRRADDGARRLQPSDQTVVTSGIRNLVVMKTAESAFSGFPRDEYTTLPETEDRILATSVTAEWTHRAGAADFASRHAIRRALLETFAGHRSRSVQHTLAAMGEAALAASPGIVDITLTLPNRHHLLVDLAPFGLDNPNEVFVATDAPYGLIEATIRR